MTRHLAFVLIFASVLTGSAQESDPFAPAEKLADGWEQMDQRLMFLMVRLVDVEANLEAIDKAAVKNESRASIAASQANRARAGNERMDLRGGGPVRWDKFYGTTAEKFFYRPTRNLTYHTETILSQKSPERDNQTESGVPSRQGLAVHQRPPQFDYMYRANETAQQRVTANVAKFGGNAAALAARRHELQLEQSKLWCEVSFRAVARNDLDRKALYRFAPSGSRNEDLLAATSFVVSALSIVFNAQKDQANTFRQIKPLISKARYELGNKWQQLRVNFRDESTDEWKFAALARRLEDVSVNLGDSYTVLVERESSGGIDRRDLYRGLLQQALLQYAETVLALDEMASEMAKASGFQPDVNRPLADVKMSLPTVEPSKESVVGKWANVRKDTSVHEFRPDGEYRYYRYGKTASGMWRRKHGKIYFQAKNIDSTLAINKWLVVDSRQDDQLKVRMEGERSYTWQALDMNKVLAFDDMATGIAKSQGFKPDLATEFVRRRWVKSNGLAFVRLSSGKWREAGENGKDYLFDEITRTADFVELRGITEKHITYRLFGSAAEISRANGDFNRKFQGQWDE